MITSLGNKTAKEIWEGNCSKGLPKHLWIRAKALMTIMFNTDALDDLRIQGQPPNIRLHKLKGNLKDYWSVTIALPWCLIFQFKNGNFSDVQIVDYH
jgi:proteic killer suppression protein